MRIRIVSFAAVALALVVAGALVARSGAATVDKPAAQAAATRVGSTEPAKWSATTYEAATNEAQKKMLAGGKPSTVTGEVVDVSCYLQLGKRGEAHVACGTKCLTNGQPIGLVDAKGTLYILFAEEHHPRRDGEADLKKTFIPLLSKQVTVNGMATEMRGNHALFVSAAGMDEVMKGEATEEHHH